LTVLCLLSAAAYVAAEWNSRRDISWLAKTAASTSFVILAIVGGAAETHYGRLVLAALCLSWVGDMLLLSLKVEYLLGGITAFLVAHIAFGTAFATRDLGVEWFFVALVILSTGAFLLLRWLVNYLDRFNRIAVTLYLIAITLMTSLAIAASAGSSDPIIAVGAVLFAVSDISVARDRFVKRSIVNKVWGIPLYYIAQLLFALSVGYSGQ
jgi:uncharacterized membrane protein YhhN